MTEVKSGVRHRKTAPRVIDEHRTRFAPSRDQFGGRRKHQLSLDRIDSASDSTLSEVIDGVGSVGEVAELTGFGYFEPIGATGLMVAFM
jgi:hypothetical protein